MDKYKEQLDRIESMVTQLLAPGPGKATSPELEKMIYHKIRPGTRFRSNAELQSLFPDTSKVGLGKVLKSLGFDLTVKKIKGAATRGWLVREIPQPGPLAIDLDTLESIYPGIKPEEIEHLLGPEDKYFIKP